MLSVEMLRTQIGAPGEERVAEGYVDGLPDVGGGRFIWVSGHHDDDGATLIVPLADGFDGSGAWRRVDDGRVLNVLDFGARGDGRTDDTRAIQRALDAARARDTVHVPARTFRIDANANPYSGAFGGLRVRSGTTLAIASGGDLRALPSSAAQSAVVTVTNASNVVVSGGGRITGERLIHQARDGEWGFGVAIWSSQNVTVRGLEVADCWGDGVYIGMAEGRGPVPRNIRVERCHLHGHRRQGISVVTAEDVYLMNNTIEGISGTPPSAGIDLEPNEQQYPCRRITIQGNTIRDCTTGVLMLYSQEVTVRGNRLSASNSGILLIIDVRDVLIADNTLVGGTENGAAAFRVAGNRGETMRNIRLEHNRLSGGREFVADVVPVASLTMVNNTLVADRAGLRLVRLLGGVTFQRNTLTKSGSPASSGDYVAHLQGTVLGGNVFRNLTGRTARVIGARNRNAQSDRFENTRFEAGQ